VVSSGTEVKQIINAAISGCGTYVSEQCPLNVLMPVVMFVC